MVSTGVSRTSTERSTYDKDMDGEGWQMVSCPIDLPQQENGYDCGVFMCMHAEFISHGYPLVFTQAEIYTCRKK